jgi:hypothetical protein
VTVVVTINDVVPPSRNDGVPWVTWFIEEGGEAGPFTQIDTNALSPVDPDPRYPAARDITTANGTADNLWYRIRFQDANGDFSDYSAPIQNAIALELPTIRQVAHAHPTSGRVTRSTNEFRGTFAHDTLPTEDEAAEAIDTARDDVLTDVGALPTGLQPEAVNAVRSLIALRAAMIIERSYYGEQVGANKSPYPALERDYLARLPRVIEAIAEAETVPPGEIVPGDPLGADPNTGTGGGSGQADIYVPAGSRVYTGSLWLGGVVPTYSFPDDDGIGEAQF